MNDVYGTGRCGIGTGIERCTELSGISITVWVTITSGVHAEAQLAVCEEHRQAIESPGLASYECTGECV